VDGVRTGGAADVAAAAAATAAAAAAVTTATHYAHDGIHAGATTTTGRHDRREARPGRLHLVDEAARGHPRVGAAGHGRRPHRCGERTRRGRVSGHPDAR